MADFIGPVIDWLAGVLAQKGAVAPMPDFGEVRKSWTGVVASWPPAAVLGRTTNFDPESAGTTSAAHLITVKFGVNGADSDKVVADAFGYMKAIDWAVTSAVPPDALGIKRVFVQAHDYGVLFAEKSTYSKFPELHLVVEQEEA